MRRAELPSLARIVGYWSKQPDFTKRLGLYAPDGFTGIYLEAPHCWACHDNYGNASKWMKCYWVPDEMKQKPRPTPEQIDAAWNKAPLIRCHIVPDALGGSSDPSNLVLLCKRCHELAPDVIDPEAMWYWIRNEAEKYGDRCVRERTEAFEQANRKWGDLKPDAPPLRSLVENIACAFDHDEVLRYSDEFVSFTLKNYASDHFSVLQGSVIKVATYAAALYAFAEREMEKKPVRDTPEASANSKAVWALAARADMTTFALAAGA
jgi:hypothetical protein